MPLETIEVGQGDGPILHFRLKERLPDGTMVPYSLAGGATVHFIGKTNRDDTDGSAVFNYTGAVIADGTAPGATYSLVDITVSPSNTANVTTYYAKLVVTKGGAPDTVKQVWFKVANT